MKKGEREREREATNREMLINGGKDIMEKRFKHKKEKRDTKRGKERKQDEDGK